MKVHCDPDRFVVIAGSLHKCATKNPTKRLINSAGLNKEGESGGGEEGPGCTHLMLALVI